MLPLPQQPRRRHTARRTARLLQYSPPQRQRDRRYFFLLRLWRFPPSCGVTLLFRGCAVRRSLRVLSAICGRPTISGVRILGGTMLCTVVVCCISLCSRRDGDTAGRRSDAGATGETAGRLLPSADAGDTAGVTGIDALAVGDGGCTAACGMVCTAVRGVGCPDIDAAVCGCCTTGVTRREPTSALGICLACCAACCTGGAGGIMRLGGDTAEPAETAGAVLLGWTADAVCPCAAVAAATAAAGPMPDE